MTEHQVINPSGKPGIYGTIHFKNMAVGVVPIEENGDTYLVGQYRFPLKAYSWEIPEGGGALNVPALVTAKRELREETGLVAKHFHRLCRLHLSNSVSDEVAFLYLATGLVQRSAMPEEDEDLRVKRVALKQAVQMALSGKITDAMAVCGLILAWQWWTQRHKQRD